MNKKFLSVILFSALMVGTAGTFTSCKDYDDDIEGLENRVSAVETLVNKLQEKIDGGSVITSVEKNDEGIVIKLSNGESYPIKNGANGNSPVIKIGDNGNWFIDGEDTGKPSKGEGTSGVSASTIYFYPGTAETGKEHGQEENGYWVKVTIEPGKDAVYQVQSTKWLPEGTLTAVWNTKDQTLTLGNMKDDNGKLVSKTISLSTELKSLVFIPDLYEDGVEATKYEYAPGIYISGVKDALTGNTDDKGVAYEIKKNTSPTSWTNIATEKGKYWMASTGVMYYHMNPLNANLKNIDWTFLGATPEYVATKAAPAVVTPIFQKVAKTEDGNKMYATYKLSVEDLKKGNIAYPGDESKDKSYISIAALQATLAKGEKEGEEKSTVTSDYAAIMPVVQNFAAIAYINNTTTETCKEELYKTAKAAIENKYTIDVQYNGGSIKLADKLNIHYTENYLTAPAADVDHKKMSIAEVAAKYGLTLKFEAVHYISGKNDTEENAYSTLTEEGVFTPCYVDKNGASVAIPEGNTDATGRSAIGRRPVVLAKLVDAANNVVLAGYIKLEITEKSATPDAIVIDKSTPQLPYLCGDQKQAITWKDMSGKVLEELNLTKEEFTANYKFVAGETYVADGKGGFTQVVKPVKNAYGVITETPDDHTSTNAILTWATTQAQRDQLIKDYKDRTLTLYGKYVPESGAGTYAIYVGIKISIAELPTTASYGNKRDAYWYPEGTPVAERTNVRTNVPAPNTDKKVTEYVKNLDDYFWHLDANKKEVSGIEFTISDASKPVYGEIWNKKDKGMEIKYSYLFSAKNEGLTIGGKKLFVNQSADKKSYIGTELYWGDSRANASLIATLNKSTHVLTYADNAQAKVFLNLFGHNESMPNQQYAIIEISSVYGECEIELAPSYNFNARFLRPLDIASNDNAKFTDAEAGGSSVRLGDLFTAKDWRDKVVINYNTTSKAYEAVSENGINLYNYYEIKEVALDLDKATCDINTIGTQMPINKDVVKLSVLDANNAVVASNKVDIATTNIANLNTYKLNYKNNEGNTKAFTIMVPIKVTYAWGEVEAMVSIAVAGTIANR